MNEEQIKEIISKIETINPHPKEAIVLYCDVNKISPDTLEKLGKSLKNIFPNNKIIILPKTTQLESLSKDILENIISHISEVIDEI